MDAYPGKTAEFFIKLEMRFDLHGMQIYTCCRRFMQGGGWQLEPADPRDLCIADNTRLLVRYDVLWLSSSLSISAT